VQAFNARAQNTRIIYLNQFGFDRSTCGLRVPEQVEFLDIRRASDVEFGLSLYEPFGISPLEPLTYGGLCVLSTTCGCAGFIRQAAGNRATPNVVLANYIDGVRRPRTMRDALAIEQAERRDIERRVAEQVAEQILKRLPPGNAEREALLQSGYDLARKMSWDAVAERFVMPAIRRALAHRSVVSNVA
jgi:glycogen synthase